jgi:hypothetical protein
MRAAGTVRRPRRVIARQVVAALLALLVAACTGGAERRERSGRAAAPPPAACAPGDAGGGSWRRVGAPAGQGRAQVEVTGLEAGGAGGPWLAVGSVGVPGDRPAPAVWTSPDADRWGRAQVQPVTLDGVVSRLLGVARWGRTAAAIGVTFSRGEGVARPSAWSSRDGGAWRESRANRELFGGPRGMGIAAVAAGPLGLTVAGLRNGTGNRVFAAVWRSDDGRVWRPPPQVPALEAGRGEALAVLGAAVGPKGIVVTGRAVRATDPADGVIWFAAAGRSWERVAPGPATLGGAGAQEVDRVVAVGSGFVAVGLAGAAGARRPVAWTSPDGQAWRPASGTAFAVAGPGAPVDQMTSLSRAPGGGLLAAGAAGQAPCLWRSRDGAAWAPEPLPAAARVAGLRRVLAADDGARTVVVLQGTGRAEAWARPSAGR